MFIENINLKNFGSLKKADLHFKKGFNLINGVTGQGKSTIISAIDYSIRKNSLPLPNMVSWGERNLNSVLNLEHEGKKFRIEGDITKGKTTIHKRNLRIDKEEYDSLDEISNILSGYFDPSLCGAALLTKQGETELIEAKPAERKAILQKIYDLDFKQAISDLENIKKEQEEELRKIEDKILVLENKEYRKLEIVELPYSEEEVKEFQKKISEIQKELFAKEQSLIELKKLQEKVEELEKDYLFKQGKVSLQEKEYDAVVKTISSKKEIHAKNKSEFENTDWEEKAKKIKEEIENLPPLKRIASKENNLPEMETVLRDLYSEMNKAKSDYGAVQEGKCPTCKRPYESSTISDYKEAFQKFTLEYEEYKKEYENHKEEIKEYEKLVEENRQNKELKASKEAEYNYEMENSVLRKQNAEQALKSLEDELETYKKEEERLKVEIANLEKDVLSAKTKLVEEKSNLEAMPEIVSPENLQNKIEVYQSKIDGVNEVKTRNEQAKNHNQEIESLKKQDKQEIVRVKKERDKVTEEIDLYVSCASILKKDFPNYVITQMIGGIEEGINDFIDRVYDGRYQVKMKETKSGIEMLYGPEEVDVRQASGGEQQIYNVSCLVAYAKLANLGVLILDEAFSMLNEDLEIKAFSAIQEMIEDGIFNQVIYITHRDETKNFLITNYQSHVIDVHDGIAEVADG